MTLLFRYVPLYDLAIRFEEVIGQYVWNADQQIRVNTGAFENTIDIGAFTIDLLGEPGYTSSLFAKHSFYNFSDMNGVHVYESSWLQKHKIKSANIIHAHSLNRGSGNDPANKNEQ